MKYAILHNKSMILQIKIALPWYLLVLGLLFSVFLPFISSVTTYDEIGVALDANFAFLAIIIFADTYYVEIQKRTAEVFYLLLNKPKMLAVNKRILVKYIFLMLLFTISYLLFNIHKPHLLIDDSYINLFLKAVFAVGSSIFFWGVLAYSLVNISHNLWVGVGISMVIWVIMNSTIKQSFPAFLNMFAYGSSNAFGEAIANWEISKIVGLVVGFFLLFINTNLIKQSPCEFKE